jgi:hypothetical protein
MMIVPHRRHLYTSTAYYWDRFTSLYVDVRASQETHLWAFAACYGDRFTFLYADDRTSQETHVGLHGVSRG